MLGPSGASYLHVAIIILLLWLRIVLGLACAGLTGGGVGKAGSQIVPIIHLLL